MYYKILHTSFDTICHVSLHKIGLYMIVPWTYQANYCTHIICSFYCIHMRGFCALIQYLHYVSLPCFFHSSIFWQMMTSTRGEHSPEMSSRVSSTSWRTEKDVQLWAIMLSPASKTTAPSTAAASITTRLPILMIIYSIFTPVSGRPRTFAMHWRKHLLVSLFISLSCLKLNHLYLFHGNVHSVIPFN